MTAATDQLPRWSVSDLHESFDARSFLTALESAGSAADRTIALFDEHGVPAGYVFRAPEMLADPHFAARESIVRMEHPTLGEFPMQGVFPKFKTRPLAPRSLAPGLGEHTREVLAEWLELDEDMITKLSDSGVIGAT